MKYTFLFFCSLLALSSHSFCAFTEHSFLFRGTYSENYVMRWAFQELCEYSFDPRTDRYAWPTSGKGISFDPAAIQGGELVFVRNLDTFFNTLFKEIRHPFVMITAGEARDKVEQRHMDYLDDKRIIAWFSVHASCHIHPKFYPLPLGIYQDKTYYYTRSKLTHHFAQLRAAPKKKMLYMNFGDLKGKKPDRAEVIKQFKKARYCYNAVKRIPFLDYMEEMSQFKFTLSPPGYGPDCYRTWEALLVGSIPIVKKSHLDCLFEGLPVLFVDEWTDITEKMLEQAYAEFSSKKYAIEQLYVEYWAEKIKRVRDSFMATYRGK